MASRTVFVVGAGPIGREFVRVASSRGHRITALEADVTQAEQLGRLKGVRALVLRDVTLDELRNAGVARADLVLATSDSNEENLRTITYALELGVPHVGTLASDEEYRDIFRRLGARTVITPSRIVSEHLCELFLLSSVVFDTVLHDGSRLVQIAVDKESPLCGKDPTGPDLLSSEQWVINVARSGKHLHPASVEIIEEGDFITFFFAQQSGATALLASVLR